MATEIPLTATHYSLIIRELNALVIDVAIKTEKHFRIRIIKVGVNHFLLYHSHVLAIVQKSWTSLCELIHFISRLHLLHFTSSSTSLSWHIRLRWLKETTELAEWDDCINWRSRMQWLMETNAIAEGVECDSWRSRMQWLKESNPMTEGDECDGWRRRNMNLWIVFFYTIPHRDNNINIVVFHILALRFSL